MCIKCKYKFFFKIRYFSFNQSNFLFFFNQLEYYSNEINNLNLLFVLVKIFFVSVNICHYICLVKRYVYEQST